MAGREVQQVMSDGGAANLRGGLQKRGDRVMRPAANGRRPCGGWLATSQPPVPPDACMGQVVPYTHRIERCVSCWGVWERVIHTKMRNRLQRPTIRRGTPMPPMKFRGPQSPLQTQNQ